MHRMLSKRSFVGVVLAGLVGCEWTPRVVDSDTGAELGVILGDVLVVGPERPSDTFVLLYDATNPGPPAGFGSPINFDVIPAEAFEESELGSWTAPYALTAVPPGQYLMSALHDTDRDFSPVVDIASGSTCGDWGGGFVGWVESEDGTSGPDTVSFELGPGELLDGVPAAVQVPIPIEKPAFTILGGDGIPARGQVGLDADGTLVLAATVVGTEYLELGPLQDLEDKQPCRVSFPFVPVVSYDENGSVSVDDMEPPLVFFTQILDPADEAAGAAPVVIQGIVEYSVEQFLFQLLSNSSMPGEALELSVRISENGRYFLPFSSSATGDGLVSELPAGPWAVTVVNAAGQTWTVPNEFGQAETNPTGGFVPATQGASVVFR